MTYDLAKQLKEAGFPQPDEYNSGKSGMSYDTSGTINYYDNCCGFWRGDSKPDAYIPTLSELIEACGDYFDFLSYGAGWKSDGTRNKPEAQYLWKAYGGIYGKGSEAFWASTPEEAVAQLWLKFCKP